MNFEAYSLLYLQYNFVILNHKLIQNKLWLKY